MPALTSISIFGEIAVSSARRYSLRLCPQPQSPVTVIPICYVLSTVEMFTQLAFLSGAWCRSGGGGGIIRNDFEGPHPDGSYRWALQTDEGIFHEQRGSFPPNAEHEPSLVVEGQYQYTAPDGQVINVLYTADEYGFHPTGAHLPTPPPIPPAIQRSLDYIARVNQNQL